MRTGGRCIIECARGAVQNPALALALALAWRLSVSKAVADRAAFNFAVSPGVKQAYP